MTNLRFGLPEDTSSATQDDIRRMRPPLRAQGSLNYRQFISLVRQLWEEIHPDIKIKPTQSGSYAEYPVIIYSLENRKTMGNEPKQRHREEIRQAGSENVVVTGQRFQNYVAFSAIDPDPDLCEAIIETFEEFMLEHTPVFKKFGLSDIFYSRRLSDREETRTADDVSIRTVVYMAIIEHVASISVSKIEKIVSNVSISTKSLDEWDIGQATPNGSWLEVDIDDSIDEIEQATPDQ